MTTPTPNQEDNTTAPVAPLVLDHSAKPLPNPEPKTAGTTWEELEELRRIGRREAEFIDLVERGINNDFPDVRRPSESPQPPAVPHKSKAGDQRRSTVDLTNDARYPVKGIRGLAPAREVKLEELGEEAVKTEYPSSSEEEEEEEEEEEKDDAEPSAADKLGITLTSPASPKTANNSPGHSEQRPATSTTTVQPGREEPASAAEKLSGAVQPPTTPKEASSPGQQTVFQEVSGGSYQWYTEQDKSQVPDSAELRSATKTHVAFEEDARFLEFAADITGLAVGVDPRHSFRDKIVPNMALAQPAETAAWKKLLAGIDPRETFRRGAENGFASVAAAGDDDNTDGGRRRRRTTTTTRNLPEPTLIQQPTSWLDRIIEDYPGGLRTDLCVLLLLLFLFIALPLSVIFLVATTYGTIDYQSSVNHIPFTGLSQLRPIGFILSSLAPSLGIIPGFYNKVVPEKRKQPGPRVSPLVHLDPLGINKVLDWPITLPDLQALNTSFSLIAPAFSDLDQALKLAPATTALQLPARSLSNITSERLEALESLQKALSDLTLRYDIFISSLLKWSDWTSHNIISSTRVEEEEEEEGEGKQPSPNLRISNLRLLLHHLLLLRGPWPESSSSPSTTTTTEVQHLKANLLHPIHELNLDLIRLESQTILLAKALQKARLRVVEFKFALAEAEEWFVGKCLRRRNAWGWEWEWWWCRWGGSAVEVSTTGHVACRGWNPSEISRHLMVMNRGGVGGREEKENEEEVAFEMIEEMGRRLLLGVWALGNFYFDVRGELKDGEGSGRGFGEVEFDSLEEVGEFVEGLRDRIVGSARELRGIMGKRVEE